MFRANLLNFFRLPLRQKTDRAQDVANEPQKDFRPEAEDVSYLQDLLIAPGEDSKQRIVKDSWEHWKP